MAICTRACRVRKRVKEAGKKKKGTKIRYYSIPSKKGKRTKEKVC
jgi:hypothetical protein